MITLAEAAAPGTGRVPVRPARILELRTADGPGGGPDKTILLGAAQADALVACLREPEEARAMAQRGRSTVICRYDWDALAEELDRVWLDSVRALG